MRPAKSQGGPDRECMKDEESGHRLWLAMMNHIAQLNQLLEEDEDRDKTEDRHDEHMVQPKKRDISRPSKQ